VIRMCSDAAFVNDPLRILRGIRFAGSYGMEIEKTTLDAMRRYSHLLQNIAVERVLSELFEIFSFAQSARLIALLDDLGGVAAILPETESMRGCTQNNYHHLDVWRHSLAVLENCEVIIGNLNAFFGDASVDVEECLAENDRLPLLKMAALLHDVGKPPTRNVRPGTGRVTFYGHDRVGSEIVRKIAKRFKMAKRDRAFLGSLVAEHLHVLNLSAEDVRPTTRLRLLRKHGDDVIPLIILGMADIKGTLGPQSSPEAISRHVAWSGDIVREYFRSVRRELGREDLLSGKDLIAIGIKPGPGMGEVLRKIREAQDEGKVKSREEALALAKKLGDCE